VKLLCWVVISKDLGEDDAFNICRLLVNCFFNYVRRCGIKVLITEEKLYSQHFLGKGTLRYAVANIRNRLAVIKEKFSFPINCFTRSSFDRLCSCHLLGLKIISYEKHKSAHTSISHGVRKGTKFIHNTISEYRLRTVNPGIVRQTNSRLRLLFAIKRLIKCHRCQWERILF